MKFQHCSIPADNPKLAAETLGRIFGGAVTRFPPGGPDSWMAWSSDETLQMEFTPRGNVLVPDDNKTMLGVREGAPVPNSEVHLGLCVETPEAEILSIANEVGWPAYSSVRIPGDEGFAVVELWVEGKFLLELCDPIQSARLQNSVTVEGWNRLFSLE